MNDVSKKYTLPPLLYFYMVPAHEPGICRRHGNPHGSDNPWRSGYSDTGVYLDYRQNPNLFSGNKTCVLHPPETLTPVPPSHQEYVQTPAGIPATATTQPSRAIETALSVKKNETGDSSRTFRYILRGRSGSIPVTLDSGVYNNLEALSTVYTCSTYAGDSSPCTQEENLKYFLKYLNEPPRKAGWTTLSARSSPGQRFRMTRRGLP